MSIKFKAKILSALLIVAGACGFSAVHAGDEQVCAEGSASTGARKYTERYILDLLRSKNEDKTWEFLCDVIDNDDVESLYIFFSNLDCGDTNYFFYSPYCAGMTVLMRAQFCQSEDVYRYLCSMQYGG